MRNISLFVLIDALGWRLLEGREFLSDLLPYRYPLRTVLGFSSAAIPTILTGLPPARHGHWNLLYYDPKNSPFWWLRYFGFLPDSVLDTRVGRKVIQQLGRRVLGMGPGFECCVSPRFLPHFNWVEKRSLYGLGGIDSSQFIFDRLAASGSPFRVYSYHQYSDETILETATRDIRAGEASFFFLYLSEMDAFLHMNCTDTAGIDRKIAWYAEKLEKVFRAARQVDPQARFSVFSDHGMTPITRQYDLMKDVETLRLSMPHDYLAVYDSTMARYWFFSDEARRRVPQILARSVCGRILPDSELRDLGVFFPDSRFGELIFLLHPGWILARSDFNGARWDPIGMHGYHPDDPFSDAAYLSSAPPDGAMRTIADIYAEMCAAMAPSNAVNASPRGNAV